MRRAMAFLVLLMSASNTLFASQFTGELKLLPEGCQFTKERKCQLGSMLTFKSPNGLVWQTDIWKAGNHESGTTDGASIPKWAQPIIGDAYDASFLKAAIVHDHYCYEENRVRSWVETHRMFYYALIDLGIDKVKAKTMYFAVFTFGPHWRDVVEGEKCGENCIKTLAPSGLVSEESQLNWDNSITTTQNFKAALEADPSMSLNEIETYAESAKPNDFYVGQGSTYVPEGVNDPNLLQKY
ncbi:DUF1353 domain-containing protein [Pseudomonas brassicacearum]|uniref:DUF1353 domain-containing protein n=1 Tax=Pseudomonas brassicacearum TaxID=930166 RepID=UPI00076148C9|nr:DUF1353 domain-containing protein [Pseudomonas brassicacearum]